MQLLSGSEASAKLAETPFIAELRELYQGCPWATPFQSPEFLLAWYQRYGAEFAPVLVYDQRPPLRAFLGLARNIASGEVVIAGAHQAEYQAWLADDTGSDEFIAAAVRLIANHFQIDTLSFKFVPARAPLQWADGALPDGTRPWVTRHRSPIIDLTKDTQSIEQTLRKKSNKSRLNRLGKLGEVSLQQLDYDELAAVLDEVSVFYDLRQGAMNGICPFRADPHKKAFHLDLMAAGLLHASVLRAGDELVGALLGIQGHDGVSVGVYAYSPTQSRHSPGKFLLLMLALELAGAGMKKLDLTPGGEWKERFANAHDEVSQVTLYFGASGAHRRRAEETLLAGGRKLLALAGLTPDDARATVGKLKRRVADVARLPQRLTDRSGVLIFFRDTAALDSADGAIALRRDVIADLLLYEPHRSGPDKQAFLSDSLYRLTDGQQLRTLVEDGRLVHHAWLVYPAKTQEYREVGQRYRYPDATLLLADWRTTNPSARESVLRATVLDAIEAAREVSAAKIALALAEDRRDARALVEQLGFEPHERLVRAPRPDES